MAENSTLYNVHPGVAMVQNRVATLQQESGRPAGEGVALLRKPGLPSEKMRRNWLKKFGPGIGRDIKACPGKTMAPLYRKHVLAQIKPATRTRIDLGFASGARRAEGSLIDTGGRAKKDHNTHRIPLTSLDDINAEVRQWLCTACEEDQ